MATWASAEFCRNLGETFSATFKHNQATKPFSACERSHPLTHTATFMYPSLHTRSPTQRAPLPPCSLLRRPPPRHNCITRRSKKKSDVAQPRQGRRDMGRGCGQQLVIARRVGSRLVVNGRKMEGRGGAGRGSATWFRGRETIERKEVGQMGQMRRRRGDRWREGAGRESLLGGSR